MIPTLLFAATAAFPQAANSPDALVETYCTSCVVNFREPIVFGGENPALPSFSAFAVDASRRLHVISHHLPTEVVVFDRTGRDVTHRGREGGGPGEFEVLNAIWASADTTFVSDIGNGSRLTVLGPDGRVLRTGRLTGNVRDVAELPDGRFVVAAVTTTPQAIGMPMHIVDRNGRYTRSFGADSRLYTGRMLYGLMRAVAVAPTGDIWSVNRTVYRVERWDSSGSLQAAYLRDVPWFRPYDTPGPIAPDTPPDPWVAGTGFDRQGRLWVFVLVADRQWSNALYEVEGPEGTGYRITDPARAYDTVIEVVDPNAAAVVYSRRYDGVFGDLIDGQYVASMRGDENGVPYLVLWRAALEPGGER